MIKCLMFFTLSCLNIWHYVVIDQMVKNSSVVFQNGVPSDTDEVVKGIEKISGLPVSAFGKI